jgi:putative redox protein
MSIDCETEQKNEYPQTIRIREHTLRADVGENLGSHDSAPSPHDYFDASLVACKTLTATWFARKHGIALERVEAHVEHDDSEERAGKYLMRVRVAFHGPITDDERARLFAAVAKCPVHKLMTTTEITIETTPLEPARVEIAPA